MMAAGQPQAHEAPEETAATLWPQTFPLHSQDRLALLCRTWGLGWGMEVLRMSMGQDCVLVGLPVPPLGL